MVVACALSSCAAVAKLSVPRATPAQLRLDPKDAGDDAAIVLHRADRALLDEDQQGDGMTEQLRHEVIAVRKEAAFDLAEVRIPFWGKAELLALEARVHQPDGTVVEVPAKDVLSDTNVRGENDLNARFFRFPDVRLGSVLEYAYVIRTPWLVPADDQATLGAYPVRSYEFELTGLKPLVLEAIEYNSREPIRVSTLADGKHWLRFSLRDLPKRDPERFAPHWTFTEPRWAWRVLAWRWKGFSTDWRRSWSDVAASLGRRLVFDADTIKDFSVTVDFAGCGDVRCKAERAFTLLQDKTTTLDVSQGRRKPLAAAFASGLASCTERAAMLHHLLTRAGVEVRFGWGTDALSRQTTDTFPEEAQLNHLVIVLPAQAGLDKPLVIDPECDHCTVGQLGPELWGQPLFVFAVTGNEVEAKAEGAWQRLDAEPGLGSSFTLEHRARLEADGTLVDELTFTSTGADAAWWLSTKLNGKPGSLARELRRRARTVSSLAEVKHVRFGDCERRRGRCQVFATATYPRHAAANEGQWLVPLTALHWLWDDLFDAPSRKLPVHIQQWPKAVERFTLQLPAGFRAGSLPQPGQSAVDGGGGFVRVEQTASTITVARELDFPNGAYPVARYGELRAAAGRFQGLRRRILVLDRSP